MSDVACSSKVDISIDPFTAHNPSYCFVDLTAASAATSAMKTLNGTPLFGRPLKIKPCIQKRGTNQTTRAEGLIFERWKYTSRQGSISLQSPLSSTPVQGNRRLYVGGLPKPLDQHTSDAEIRALFRDFNVEDVSKVKSPRVSVKGKSGNHFYAFVDFATQEEAEAAVSKVNGLVAFGGRLRVSMASSMPRN